jgi:hypothetical protein
MDIFDDMCDQLTNGEILIADFDSGITLSADMEKVAICYEDEEAIVDITLTGEEIDTLHLLLEAVFVARQNLGNINWDELLIGN